MNPISITDIHENLPEMIGQKWMLISAGDRDKFNTMTASWGFVGYYANRYCAVVFVRPERYTFEFVEQSESFTLSFFPDGYKKALSLLGTKSGRECDKVTQAGLTPLFTENGNPTFAEATLTIECKKLYGAMLASDGFIDKSLLDKWYDPSHGNLHKMYIAEITDIWQAE